MSEDMNPSELEQATEEQLARFNEALEEQGPRAVVACAR